MDDLPQNQPPEPYVIVRQGFLQTIKGKLVSLGAVILLLLLSLLILNYFTSFIPLLPHRQLNQNTSMPPTDFTSNPLFEKAKSLGYDIIWMDPADTTGRTIFYKWRGDNGYGGAGVKEVENFDGTTYIRHITGIFQGFENIPESNDKYALLTNPRTNEALPLVRLLFEGASSKRPSNLGVEKLGIPLDSTEFGSEYLGTIPEMETNLENILKPGDAVVAQLSITGTSNFDNSKDQNGNFEIFFLFLRRFDGKTQIERETGANL